LAKESVSFLSVKLAPAHGYSAPQTEKKKGTPPKKGVPRWPRGGNPSTQEKKKKNGTVPSGKRVEGGEEGREVGPWGLGGFGGKKGHIFRGKEKDLGRNGGGEGTARAPKRTCRGKKGGPSRREESLD